MRKHFALSIFTSLIFACSGAQASCGSAVCPLDTRSSLQREKGWISMGYEWEYIDQNTPRIGTRSAAVGEIPGHHDEQRTINRVQRFWGLWVPSDRLSLDLSLPLASRSHRHVHNHMGEAIPEGWDFTQIGDLSVQTRVIVFKPENTRRPSLSGIFGIEFPTGKSHITNADGDEAEPGITPGSASYDITVGAASLQNFSLPTLQGPYALMPLFFSVTYKMNGQGHENYRLGNVLSVNGGIIYPILNRLGLIGQMNLLVKEQDERGETVEEVEKTGGEFVYVSPGVLVHLRQNWDATAVVQIPIHQRVNSIQLTSNYNLQLGVSYRFKI